MLYNRNNISIHDINDLKAINLLHLTDCLNKRYIDIQNILNQCIDANQPENVTDGIVEIYKASLMRSFFPDINLNIEPKYNYNPYILNSNTLDHHRQPVFVVHDKNTLDYDDNVSAPFTNSSYFINVVHKAHTLIPNNMRQINTLIIILCILLIFGSILCLFGGFILLHGYEWSTEWIADNNSLFVYGLYTISGFICIGLLATLIHIIYSSKNEYKQLVNVTITLNILTSLVFILFVGFCLYLTSYTSIQTWDSEPLTICSTCDPTKVALMISILLGIILLISISLLIYLHIYTKSLPHKYFKLGIPLYQQTNHNTALSR